ncbi:MAG: hypothetical protein J0L64_02305 [Acidobacteria bacterium]|nr:hypothetical protein [Acidobacteriota bacterium]
MKRIVWGIIVCVFGLLFMASAQNNPNGPAASVLLGLLCLAGGGLLLWFGLQQRTLERKIGDAALSSLQQLGYVPCDEVARSVGVGEYRTRLVLRKLQLKGMVPLRVER